MCFVLLLSWMVTNDIPTIHGRNSFND